MTSESNCSGIYDNNKTIKAFDTHFTSRSAYLKTDRTHFFNVNELEILTNFVVSLNVSLFARTRNFAAAAKFVSEKQKNVSLFRKKLESGWVYALKEIKF